MPIATREAESPWEGSLANGAGKLTSGIGAFGEIGSEDELELLEL